MRDVRSMRRWRAGALPLAILMTSPALAQTPPQSTTESATGSLAAPADGAPASASAPAAPEAVESALAKLDAAADRWNRSCKKPDPQGLCVTISPSVRKEFRCGVPRLGRVQVIARRPKAALRASKALDTAIAEAERVGAPTEPTLANRYLEALNRARLARADRDLEHYLTLTMPRSLEFYVEEWKKDSGIPKWEKEYRAQHKRKRDSEQRFKTFVEDKTTLMRTLDAAYAEISRDTSKPELLSLVVRQAMASQHMADQLVGAPVPKSLRKPELRPVYCGALEDVAEPLETKAHQALQWCTERAESHSLTGPDVEACQARLAAYPPPKAD